MKENKGKKIYLRDFNDEFSFSKKIHKKNISFNRIAFIFFIFLFISSIFSVKIFYYGSISKKELSKKKNSQKNDIRSDIIDADGNILAKTVFTKNVGINPKLEKDKKKLFIKLKLLFPELDIENFNKKFEKKNFFYIKKRLTPEQYYQVRNLGEKSVIIEQKISRIYPHENLFSHVLGQIDDNNNGISGIEKSLDKDLKKINKKLKLTLDTNIQFLIRNELINFEKIFKSKGSAAVLMNINSGEILSLVSLPDFNINKREDITDVKFINRITKGIYELGSIFKTFTLAAALNDGIINPDTKFQNLPKSIYCAGRKISEYDMEIPSTLTAEQILIRSGNIGSVRIAQKMGIEKTKNFLDSLNLLTPIEFDLGEIGKPLLFKWGKCKLATVSFGHGISTTPLQVATAYAIISNGGFKIKPTLLKKEKNIKKKKILNEGVSININSILRKIVSTKEGTANLANVEGYSVAGKTGTAQKIENGIYTKKKINTFVSIFPINKPKYVLLVLLDEPKTNSEYVYNYRDGSGIKYKGTPFNTAGWTTVEVAGKIIEKIGPILATKYDDFY